MGETVRDSFADSFARLGRAIHNLSTATASPLWWPWQTHEYRTGEDANAAEAYIETLPIGVRAMAREALRYILRRYQRGMAEVLSVMDKFLRALEDARRRARLRERVESAGWPEPEMFVPVQDGVVRRPWRRWKMREASAPSWARAKR